MRKFILLIMLVCSHASMQAEDDLRLTAETEPLATMCGCVNAVSGDFFFSDADILLMGSEPLHLINCFDSGHRYYGVKGMGYGDNFSILLERIYSLDKGITWITRLEEREGLKLPYKGRYKDGAYRLEVDPKLFEAGFTNYSELGISGRDSIKNRRMVLPVDSPYVQVIEGSGIIRQYDSYWVPDMSSNLRYGTGWRQWHLSKETRPNGHKVLVDYARKDLPKRICTTNSEGTVCYNWMEFSYDGNGHTVTTHNGQSIRYNISPIKVGKDVRNYLTSVNPSHGVPRTYHIDNSRKIGPSGHITCISKPDGRDLKISYGKGDKAGKVVCLHAPAGPNNTDVAIANFDYPDKETTEFRNAQGTKTTYRSKAKRITAIESYDKHNKLYASQQFLWGTEKTNIGQLLAKGRANSQNAFLNTTTVTYDDRGNILKEELYGNLTGNSPDTFAIDANFRPTSPTECYTTEFVYSTDGFNLVLSERHPGGKHIEYTYLPGTDLCTSKLICSCDAILSREFNLYEDGFLTCTIADDGSTPNLHDLAIVHTRTIKRIIRRTQAPAIAFPETIIESYLDLATHAEIQLKKSIKHYNSFEQLTQEDVYDAYDTYQYSLSYSYDDKGNLISKTDPIGRVTHYCWDANKNKVVEEVHGSDLGTVYHYDCCNRLIKECEYHINSSIFVTEHTYDVLGNRTSTRDHLENVTRYEYDEFGRQTRIHLPICITSDGRAYHHNITRQYDLLGNVAVEIDSLGNTTTTRYNIRGQPIEIVYPNRSNERFEYNLDGTLAKKWEKSGLCSQHTYDGLQRLIQTDCYDLDGTLLRTTRNIYSGTNLVQAIDPMGNVTEYRYDGAGRKIEELQSGSRTTYEYDSMGRHASTTQWIDESAYVCQVHVYDLLNRIIEQRSEDQAGNILRQERYAYDIRGNRTLTETFIDELASSVTKTVYDTRNKPIWIQDALGNVTTIHNFERENNPLERYLFKKTTTDSLGIQTIEVFDPTGRLSTTEKRNASQERLSYQSIFYDPAGNKEYQQEVVYAAGQIKGTYTVDWVHDGMGNLLAVTEKGSDGLVKTTRYTYDHAGRLQTITKPDGVVLHHAYDTLGRLIELASSDRTIAYQYVYDANDNVISVTDTWEISLPLPKRVATDSSRPLDIPMIMQEDCKPSPNPTVWSCIMLTIP